DFNVLRENIQRGLDQLFGAGNASFVSYAPTEEAGQEYYLALIFSNQLTEQGPVPLEIWGGAGINLYPETDRTFNELQRLKLGGQVTGGSFTLGLPASDAQTVVWSAD